MTTAKKGVRIRDKIAVTHVDQIFNRLILITQGTGDLQDYFKYELSPYPTSLFENASLMRKGAKSQLFKEFSKGVIQPEELPKDVVYVLDGGNILHSMNWPKPATYGQIIDFYISYVQTFYGTGSVIVFDGYPNYPTTKNQEQKRNKNIPKH